MLLAIRLFRSVHYCADVFIVLMFSLSLIRNSENKAETDQRDHGDYVLIEVFVKISMGVD